MNLVKWFRKNRTKVMAVVVIVILFGFIGGSAFLQFLSRRSTGLHKTVAYFSDNRKITNNDIVLAREELRILELMEANELLISMGMPLFRDVPDFRALLMGQLLFSERRASPGLVNYIRQTIRTNGYRISDKQVSDIYKRSVPSEIYWHCLKKEAQLAGVKIPNKDARTILADVIPQIPRFRGATYSQLIGSVVRRWKIPEEEILKAFGKLLEVWEYSKICCSSDDVTSSQIMHMVSWDGEVIDVDFVKFDSGLFAENQSEPNQESVTEHFNKYRKYYAGEVSQENPYGFGYKLVDRVKLEYIACRLSDVSKIVTPPTQEEAEDFYRKNREQFTEEVLSDPNDPNSLLTERIKDYAEVAGDISQVLLQNKINSEAKSILDEAKALTEAGLEGIDIEGADINAEQFKQRAGDYEAVAKQLSEKYKIRVYTGQTGLLGATDIQADEYLGRLYLRGYGETFVGLAQVVFAVDELGLSELGPFDIIKPRMYKNIGPARDVLERIMVIVRVIDAKKASEPEGLNQTFSTRTLRLDTEDESINEGDPNRTSNEDSESEVVYSVKEKVTEDLKKLAAMDDAKGKAGEFISLVASDRWDGTIEKFNEIYKKQTDQDESEPNISTDPNVVSGPNEPFKLDSLISLRRVSRERMERLSIHGQGNAGAELFLNRAKIEGQFAAQLHSLVSPDSNSVSNLPQPVEFKPDMSYYCIKEIRVRRIMREEYEKAKPIQAYKEEYIQSQSLAAVHFNPENILRRMKFRWVRETEPPADANKPPESEGES